MIITKASSVADRDLRRFSWASLRRFHHVPSVASDIIAAHALDKRHHKNAEKQARQIRYCLMQAREYFDAADVTSLSTRPTLLYYSVLSLALAQILFKGSGTDSLDAARGSHAHHGLLFKARQRPRNDFRLETNAGALFAQPMIAEQGRQGTFELWHRTARHLPMTGHYHRLGADLGTLHRVAVLSRPTDERMGLLPSTGITLMECFACCPGMSDWCEQNNVQSDVVRGTAQLTADATGRHHLRMGIHPQRELVAEALIDAFGIKVRNFEAVNVSRFHNAFSFDVTYTEDDPPDLSFPSCTMWNTNEIRYLENVFKLNEFGIIYVALFILGNYARYYPDQWMADVEQGSQLALAAEEFLSYAEWRMAFLTLDEIAQVSFVPASE